MTQRDSRGRFVKADNVIEGPWEKPKTDWGTWALLGFFIAGVGSVALWVGYMAAGIKLP